MEITTSTDRSYMIGEYSDLYKSMNNIRPRWINWDAMTDAQISSELADLQQEANRFFEAENLRMEKRDAEFKAELSLMIANGARDEAQALAWIFGADGLDTNDFYAVEEWLYSQGVSYDCQAKIKEIMKKS